MLQDMENGSLENEYRNITPTDSDIVFCFKNDSVLICRDRDNFLTLPTVQDIMRLDVCDFKPCFQYIFRFGERNCFLLTGKSVCAECIPYAYEPVRTLRQLRSRDICFAVMTAWHLCSWYRINRFCGHCGSKTVHDTAERMMRCPECGNMIYPRISPAVIIAVTNGNRILLSKYAGRNYKRFALLAGYTEIGETLEQTVQREVAEEVGIKVKNIRYYKSQPWGVDGNILMGFFCDLDGDDTIHLDRTELSHAAWYERDSIPCEDDGISLTREMIRVFSENTNP